MSYHSWSPTMHASSPLHVRKTPQLPELPIVQILLCNSSEICTIDGLEGQKNVYLQFFLLPG